MVITREFFYMEVHIGQLDNLAVGEALDRAINRYGKEFLVKLLGKDLAERYIAGYVTVPEMEALDKILVDRDAETSPIANYVFCKYLENTHAVHQGVGVTVQKAENSLIVNPIVKIVRAWNEMVDQVCELHKDLKALDLEDYKHRSRGSLCHSVCGCGDAVFKKRNRLGI